MEMICRRSPSFVLTGRTQVRARGTALVFRMHLLCCALQPASGWGTLPPLPAT